MLTAKSQSGKPCTMRELNQASGVRKAHSGSTMYKKVPICLSELTLKENQFCSMWVQPY